MGAAAAAAAEHYCRDDTHKKPEPTSDVYDWINRSEFGLHISSFLCAALVSHPHGIAKCISVVLLETKHKINFQ